MFKKLFDRYFQLLRKINDRHYFPLFIFISLYFVIPYSEFIVTALILLYFKFEAQFRKIVAKLVKPFPEWVRIGGSTIFFLVMLDDTLAYLSIIAIAFWSNRELKKREELEREEREKGLM